MSDYSTFSNKALQMMYAAVGEALQADDRATKEGTRPPHGVRTDADWKEHARGLSDEMVKRNMTFSRIDWWGEQ